MSKKEQRNIYKSHQCVTNQYDKSFKSLKSYSVYNLKDFLPNEHFQKKNYTKIGKEFVKDKLNTEPNDNKKQSQTNQKKRKLDLLTQENEILKRELVRQRIINLEKEQLYIDMKTKITNLNEQIDKLKQDKPKSKLNHVSNCTNLTLYHKHKQQYEVSIQTQNNQPNYSIIGQDKRSIVGDKQMQSIYQKLQNLKFPKKSKIQVNFDKMPSNKQKFDKIRKPNIPFLWTTNDEKQNNMRLNNLPYENTSTKFQREKIRQQIIDIYPIEDYQLQKLLSIFFE